MSSTSNPLPRPEPVRYLLFSASLRTASLNARLAVLAQQAIAAHKGTADPAAMRDLDCSSYSQEDQAKGLPPGAEAVRARLQATEPLFDALRGARAPSPAARTNA